MDPTDTIATVTAQMFDTKITRAPTFPPAFQVSAPFRNPKADLIVKSSDGFEFRVFKAFLSEGSIVFANMFDHPQPCNSDPTEPVPWPEPGRVIDRLLHYIYPVIKPTLLSLDEVIRLIRAADKWQIDVAVWMLRQDLVAPRFLNLWPLRIYAFACEMGYMQEKTASAAKASVDDPCDPKFRSELKSMSALDLLRLIKLRTDKGKTFEQCFESKPPPYAIDVSPVPTTPFHRTDADLILETSDGTKFQVFKLFLREASPRLAELIKKSESPHNNSGSSAPLVEIQWMEPSATVTFLLQYIYPLERGPLSAYSLDQVMAFLRAATVWQIKCAIPLLKTELLSPTRLATQGLRIYGFCCAMGLDAEKSIASVYAIKKDPLSHRRKEDFHQMTSVDLVTLVDKRNQCLSAVRVAIDNAWVLPISGGFCGFHSHHSPFGMTKPEDHFKRYLASMITGDMTTHALASPGVLARLMWGSTSCKDCMQSDGGSHCGEREQLIANLKAKLDSILNQKTM
ncbi:hypothetical protein CALVIDRAFT_539370 [Calocera viscosa TUFC12733]|uniref:BTB domain-containing protein n=1 Tax=Calocera viscosa (strain TUFC12733) TaxID=1330018 RepID=A0A167JWC3_CALVF|nr:hypothetical protein CALVIDRAFT_539370 [Calocera viscosa TUFC12733]